MKLVNRYFETLLLNGLRLLWDKYRALPGKVSSLAEFQGELNTLMQSMVAETIAPQTREFGVLVSDLRGFTSISERYPALAIVRLLNHYYGAMIRVIDAHGGVVDKFMGDSVMAVFDSKDNPLAPQYLLSCVIDMQLAMDEVNVAARAMGLPDIYMGIGLSYGDMVACELGSEIYRELTVLGDEVNLASRLTAFCLRGQVMMSEQLYDRVADSVVLGKTHQVHVKGKAQPLRVYEILGQTHPQQKLLPVRDVRKHYRVQVELPVTYFTIDGKQIDKEAVHARIADISYEGMRILTPQEHAPLEELMIVIAFVSAELGGEIYAKVLHCREEVPGLYSVSVEFTYLDEITSKALRVFVDHLV